MMLATNHFGSTLVEILFWFCILNLALRETYILSDKVSHTAGNRFCRFGFGETKQWMSGCFLVLILLLGSWAVEPLFHCIYIVWCKVKPSHIQLSVQKLLTYRIEFTSSMQTLPPHSYPYWLKTTYKFSILSNEFKLSTLVSSINTLMSSVPFSIHLYGLTRTLSKANMPPALT